MVVGRMSTKSPAQLVIVLRGVFGEGAGATRKWFRDDNFLLDWTGTNNPTLVKDGDLLLFQNSASGEAILDKNTFGDIPTSTFTQLVFRARQRLVVGSPTPRVVLTFTDVTTQTIDGSTANSFTINQATITAAKSLDNIRIRNVDATLNASTEWDFIYACKKTHLDVTLDVLRCDAGNGLKGEGEATLVLNNTNAKYWKTSPDNRISQGDIIMI